MQVRQIKVEQNLGDKICHMTIWVEDTEKLKEGVYITLKDLPLRKVEKEWWKIIEMYDSVLDKQDLHKPWKVGGL